MSAPRYEEIRFARPAKSKPVLSAAALKKKAAAQDEGLVRELYKRWVQMIGGRRICDQAEPCRFMLQDLQ